MKKYRIWNELKKRYKGKTRLQLLNVNKDNKRKEKKMNEILQEEIKRVEESLNYNQQKVIGLTEILKTLRKKENKISKMLKEEAKEKETMETNLRYHKQKVIELTEILRILRKEEKGA